MGAEAKEQAKVKLIYVWGTLNFGHHPYSRNVSGNVKPCYISDLVFKYWPPEITIIHARRTRANHPLV